MSKKQTDVLIIGGGLIGLATAINLLNLKSGVSVTVVEKDDGVASQQSGHNSGVIHAGIYYEPGSLKAKYCVQGHRALQSFCEQLDIPFVKCGKVIVAKTEQELDWLDRIHERGVDNGVQGLRMLSRRELREIEPQVDGRRALHSPTTAIVDFRQVAEAYAAVFASKGGELYLNTRYVAAEPRADGYRVRTSEREIDARLVINCAGLHSDIVAQSMGVKTGLRIIPFRGEYFVLPREKQEIINGLVYPVPDPRLPFLDVHLTRTIKGQVEVGPNAVLATKREGYHRRDFAFGDLMRTLAYGGFWWLLARHWRAGVAELNRSLRKDVFVRSVQRLVPGLGSDDLRPGGAGVRAQAVDGRGRLIDDFRIEEAPGAIHVLNAPSPAATSSLMIGRHIANLAEQRIT